MIIISLKISAREMINRKHRTIGARIFTSEDTVYEYFRLIKSKDINRLLDLFADDAIIYEPFSNIHGGLKGKTAIKPFLPIPKHEFRF